MIPHVLGVLGLVGGGVVAGVFVAVAVSVFPTLCALPAGPYVELHRELGQRYHPIMPLVVNGAMCANVALAVLTGGAARGLFAGAATLLLGTQFVSHLGNVPLNRSMRNLDSRAIPADWRDPRPVWRGLHLLRTTLALLALVATAIAVTLG